MASIKLIIETGEPVGSWPAVGYPLRITAEGTGMPSHIFIYQQAREAPASGPQDVFSHVAALPELEYPEGAANLAQENPWSRHASVDLWFRTQGERVEAIGLIKKSVAQLTAAVNAPLSSVEEVVL